MSTEIKKAIQLEIAHVLFIDIVGYSKLSINQQHAAVDQLTQIVRATEQFQKADASERLIKIATGDGMALVFYTSPEAPVRCAIELSRALKDHPELRLRMGVHSGPVSGVVDVTGRTNLAGAGLNLARRVMECGDAGHILLSKHVAQDLEEYEEWRPRLHDLGTCKVKHGVPVGIASFYDSDVGNPQLPKKFQALKRHRARVRWAEAAGALLVLAAIATAFVFLWQRPTRSALASVEKSIAVLPFENLSKDEENAFFTDGVQNEILADLAKIADLKVISRTSVMKYKSGAERNLREIGKQLGVAHVLEGSVQRSNNRVRVMAQLIDARNDAHLWAERYDRDIADVLAIQSEIAKGIAESLQAKLTGREEQALAVKPTNNPEAYDAYVRGLAYNLKGSSSANSLGAQKYLKEAVRLDPKFALSWALLSWVDSSGYRTQNLQPTAALREEARQAAETALALQPSLGEAVLAKGYYHYGCLKDYDTAVRYFEQARQLLPNSSLIPEFLAYVARRRGQWDRSESYFKEAERLDPRNERLLTQHALSYIHLRRFPEALRKLDQVLNITPDDVETLGLKATIAQAEGDLRRAAALLAPLHPGADDANTWIRQVYQAILERRPTQIIPRLREKLAKPDPALGFLRFWLGWAQQVAGDHAAAQESWRQARTELESVLKEQTENYFLIGLLALTNMGLGDKAAALALAERGMAAVPIEKDPLDGPGLIEILARVSAQMGELDRAIAALQKVLSIPYSGPGGSYIPLTPALLRLDPMFDPLRNDPRFQELCRDKQP